MHASTLLSLLPLLPFALAAPRKYPLPYLLRRDDHADALDLPPPLTAAYTNSASAESEPTVIPTSSPTGGAGGIWQVDTIPLSLVAGQGEVSYVPTVPVTAGYTASETAVWLVQPTPTPGPVAAAQTEGSLALPSAIISTSSATSPFPSTAAEWSLPTFTASNPIWSSLSASISPTTVASQTSAVAEVAAAPSPSPTEEGGKEKKIRFKHCPESGGTVTDITISPCEGGKGTINDPCHFHAGSNYTITLSYVSPKNVSQPRSNVVARDRGMSSGSEYFPYPGQAFNACQYTSCPLVEDESATFAYEFVTMNNRFDQLTFNMTNGVAGDSLMCAHFPITFMPSLAERALLPRLPTAGFRGRL